MAHALATINAGTAHGQERVWENQYEIHHIRQLHCQRHAETRGHE